MPTLGLTGDVMLGRKVDEHQQSRPPDAIWGDLTERLSSLSGLFCNLECCLSTRGRQWTRTRRPFHFRADPEWAIPALDAVGVDGVALANNHVLDFEAVALRDTLDALDDADIEGVGAGRDVDDALEPATFSVGDCDVAVVGFTDNTPEYAAGPNKPGTARIECDVDDEADRDAVHAALDRARATDPDLVLVSLHWGPNMVAMPDEQYRRFGRWLVDEGVDLVHGHSAHVFQGVEVWDGAPICYDTGDFVDDYAVDRDLRNDRSFLFVVEVTADGSLTDLRMQPVQLEYCRVEAADEGVAAWCRETMRERSAPFDTEFEREGDALVVDLD
jgi:poly-gamma-glutamate capsule biosynthesis protein CapA/YwtB (metallophosphatase superfamily)